uniref:t-SNARE coiled-coil homology domain-containing protein n=1 Tax=Panagrolaimus sp. ES5 TaxID=591445 RepID=A0AC34GNG9_9BILA
MYEKSGDYESLTIEKINAKKMIDSMLDGFKQILSKRQEIPSEQHEAFDIRIEPIQRQTQAIINAIMTLIEKPHPQTSLPSSPAAIKKNSNIFDDCFIPEEERDAYGGISSGSSGLRGGGQYYEQQLVEQTQTQAEKHVGDLQFKLERAKEDADATKKLAQDIEDLNQVMEDLAALVHSQHDIVDSIEEHVELATYKVESGNRELKKALASKNAQVPLAAAAIGATAAGGPVGFSQHDIVDSIEEHVELATYKVESGNRELKKALASKNAQVPLAAAAIGATAAGGPVGFVAGSAALGIVAGIGGAVAGLFGGRLLKKQAQEATKMSTTEESNQS